MLSNKSKRSNTAKQKYYSKIIIALFSIEVKYMALKISTQKNNMVENFFNKLKSFQSLKEK